MKKILLATALTASVFASAAAAANFEETGLTTTFNSGILSFSLESVDGTLTSIETGATVAAYSLGRFDTTTDVSLSYGRLSDTFDLSIDYNLETAVNPSLTAYGTVGVSYVTPTSDLNGGDVYLDPTLGVSYAAAKNVDVFADVSYSWNMSNDWARQGGALTVGVDYFVNEQVTLTPSLVRTFDTGANATNLNLEAAFNF